MTADPKDDEAKLQKLRQSQRLSAAAAAAEAFSRRGKGWLHDWG